MRSHPALYIFTSVNKTMNKQSIKYQLNLKFSGAVAEILNGTSFIAMRAMITKLVLPEELGKINSLFGVFEAIVPLIYGPLYSRIYAKTINYFPGCFYIVGGGLTVPALFIF